MDEDRLPTPGELGQEFTDMLQRDFDIQDYFLENSGEILKRLTKQQIDEFTSKYCPFYDAKEVEEIDLPDYFSSALYCAYTEQDKEPEEFLQDLIINVFKI